MRDTLQIAARKNSVTYTTDQTLESVIIMSVDGIARETRPEPQQQIAALNQFNNL